MGERVHICASTWLLVLKCRWFHLSFEKEREGCERIWWDLLPRREAILQSIFDGSLAMRSGQSIRWRHDVFLSMSLLLRWRRRSRLPLLTARTFRAAPAATTDDRREYKHPFDPTVHLLSLLFLSLQKKKNEKIRKNKNWWNGKDPAQEEKKSPGRRRKASSSSSYFLRFFLYSSSFIPPARFISSSALMGHAITSSHNRPSPLPITHRNNIVKPTDNNINNKQQMTKQNMSLVARTAPYLSTGRNKKKEENGDSSTQRNVPLSLRCETKTEKRGKERAALRCRRLPGEYRYDVDIRLGLFIRPACAAAAAAGAVQLPTTQAQSSHLKHSRPFQQLLLFSNSLSG